MRGVEQRWVIRRQVHRGEVEYLRIQYNAATEGWDEEWVDDIRRALPFTRWAPVYRGLTTSDRAAIDRWRPVFIGRDPQGIQRNLDRCMVDSDRREWLESTLSPDVLQSRFLRHAVVMMGEGLVSEHYSQAIASEVYKQELEHKPVQAKDVPTIVLLDTIKRIQDSKVSWAILSDVMRDASVRDFPYKVVWAKTRKLERQGLITGVSTWESRNEYELTAAGLEYWQQHRDLIKEAIGASGIWSQENRDRLLFNHFREAEHG